MNGRRDSDMSGGLVPAGSAMLAPCSNRGESSRDGRSSRPESRRPMPLVAGSKGICRLTSESRLAYSLGGRPILLPKGGSTPDHRRIIGRTLGSQASDELADRPDRSSPRSPEIEWPLERLHRGRGRTLNYSVPGRWAQVVLPPKNARCSPSVFLALPVGLRAGGVPGQSPG